MFNHIESVCCSFKEVVTLERILLQTIKFDLQVEHPYTYLLKYAKCLKGDQQKLQKMVQMAWNFVNDSLSTVLCLQWEPEIIAVALIYLASKLSKFTVSDWKGRQTSHTRWWDMFVQDMTMDILEDICHQVLDLYQNNPKDTSESNSPPQKPPSRIESPSMTRASGVGNSQPIPTIGSYKNNNPGGFGGNVMNCSANNSKPSTSAHAATVFSGDNGGSSNNGAGSSGNNGGSSRKGGCAPLLPPAPSSYTGGSKDASNTTGGGGGGGGHYSQQHRSGVSSHSTHLYGTTTQNATANSTGSSHSALTHLQSLYSQVTLPPPPPPPPSSKYPSHPPSHSSTGRNTSPPVPSGSMVSKLQPPLPSQPAPSFNAPTYTYNHPHYANAMPPIPMAPLPRLPPPPPPPPVKSSMPSANTAIGPSIPSSSHHKQIPLPSSSYPSTSGGSGGSSSGSSRQRH